MGAVTKPSADAPTVNLTDTQVRSRDRVRDLAEVFTHQREVDAILDQFPEAFVALDAKFLEPACGSGNFLVEILRRKLRLIEATDTDPGERYEHDLLRAVGSIYGVDISPSNVAEARDRLMAGLLAYAGWAARGLTPSASFRDAAACIIEANIVVGDTLNDADRIELCDWQAVDGARFRRVWSRALVPPAARDLFWEERIQDLEPVHYTALAATMPGATAAGRRTEGAR